MARLYLSFLGTNDYLACNYISRGYLPVNNVRFVQEATLKTFCQHWEANDRGVLFVTDEAYEKNWLNDGQYDWKNKCSKPCQGLKSRIKQLNLPFPVVRKKIPRGVDENEIWSIFNSVFDVLNPEDEVIFDITHALRSIPMLAVVILNYAKVIKSIRLKGIYYGAFEALGSLHDAKQIPLAERSVAILDLTAFDQLMDWTAAIDRFLISGDAKAISMLAKNEVAPILRDTKGKDQTAVRIKSLADALDSFTAMMATCRGQSISSAATRLQEELDKSEQSNLVQPFQPLFDHIQKQLEKFNGNSFNDGLQAAQWCLDHNLIQQGYTILNEFLIGHVVTMNKGDSTDLRLRELASQAMNILQKGYDEKDWRKPACENIQITKQYIAFLGAKKPLVKIFNSIGQLRNDLNHAGFNKEPKKEKYFEKRLKKLIDDTMQIIV